MKNKDHVFITGNTRGAHEVVKQKFKVVADELKGQGRKVELPTILAEPGASWDDSIRSDIAKLMHCSEIYLLHNWQGHKRSEILRNTALLIGIKPHYLP